MSVLLRSWGTGKEWLFYPHCRDQLYRSYALYLVNVPERETNVELILERKQTKNDSKATLSSILLIRKSKIGASLRCSQA